MLFVALFIFAFPDAVEAKSYYFPSVSIEAHINRDRSMDVVETRTAYFDGTYHNIYWDMPFTVFKKPNSVSLSEMRSGSEVPYVNKDGDTSPGTFSISRGADLLHIEGHYEAYNEQKQFLLRYSVEGAASKYEDVGELYWKMIGDGWGVKTDSVTVRVYLPESVAANQIYV